MSSSSPRLLSPMGSARILSPDRQDLASNNSDSSHHHQQQHHDSTTAKTKKNFKTEYKSKFTPFDQYAYNEATDSFVKQTHHEHDNNSLMTTTTYSLSSARSNQDLANPDNSHYGTASCSISGHEMDAFDHMMLGADAHREPWYKEVVKRNEKANEYRFKSEVGHNSPLLNNYSTTTESGHNFDPIRGLSASAEIGPGGLSSPTGNAAGDGADTPAAGGDFSSSASSHKHQYKFTPLDYNHRDHFIAHMANNNNFALPKGEPTGAKEPSRRAPLGSSSSARPATRSAAQVRARSQSSRRQVQTPPAKAAAAPPTKSNQTTPTRSVAPRPVTAAPQRAARQVGAAAKREPVSTSSSSPSSKTATTMRTTRAAPSSNGLTKASPLLGTDKRVPVSTSPAVRTARSSTKAPTATAAGVANKRTPQPPAASTPTTKTLTSKTSAASRSSASTKPAARASPSATSSPGLAHGRVPHTGVKAPPLQSASSSSSSSPSSSAANRVSKTKAAPIKSSATTAVKSIKTPKAMEAAKEASIAAAAAAAVAANIKPGQADYQDQDSNEERGEHGPRKGSLLEAERHVVASEEEQNLIFTTTEAGNMLADEIAQAEAASAAKAAVAAHVESGPTISSHHKAATQDEKANEPQQVAQATSELSAEKRAVSAEAQEKEEASGKQPGEGLSGSGDDSLELVNGLAGGLVSAEDRFDSTSEDQAAAESNEPYAKQVQNEQSYDDEPYSIMTTTTRADEPKLDGQHKFNTFTLDTVNEGSKSLSSSSSSSSSLAGREEPAKEDLNRVEESRSGRKEIDEIESGATLMGSHDKFHMDEQAEHKHAARGEQDEVSEVVKEFRRATDSRLDEDTTHSLVFDDSAPSSEWTVLGGDKEPNLMELGSKNLATNKDAAANNDDDDDDYIVKRDVRDKNYVACDSSSSCRLDDSSLKAGRNEAEAGKRSKSQGEGSDSEMPKQPSQEELDDLRASIEELHLDDGRKMRVDGDYASGGASQSRDICLRSPSFGDGGEEVETFRRAIDSRLDDETTHSLVIEDSAPSSEWTVKGEDKGSKLIMETDSNFVTNEDDADLNYQKLDRRESDDLDLIDHSSPALTSADTTLQGTELDVSVITSAEPPNRAEEFVVRSSISDRDERREAEPGLVQEALDKEEQREKTTAEIRRADMDVVFADGDDVDVNADGREQSRRQQRESLERDQRLESDIVNVTGNDQDNGDDNELLMNVADLIDIESKNRQELVRKSELAHQSSTFADKQQHHHNHQDEVLLSANQLNERFGLSNETSASDGTTDPGIAKQLNDESYGLLKTTSSDDKEEDGVIKQKTEAVELSGSGSGSGSGIRSRSSSSSSSSSSISNKLDPFVGGESGRGVEVGLGMAAARDGSNTIEEDIRTLDAKPIAASSNEADEAGFEHSHASSNAEALSRVSISDDIDDDDDDDEDEDEEERLKLSNNRLTNSEDELILAPRNYNYSPSRSNVDLNLMAQEDRIGGTVEFDDGSSAAFETPTAAENRIEMSISSKNNQQTIPEISQTVHMFSRRLSEDSDDEDAMAGLGNESCSLNDPIGEAATIVGSKTGGSEELMRFNAVKESFLESAQQQVSEMSANLMAEQGADMTLEAEYVMTESVDLTSNVIDDTVKQIHHELGETERPRERQQQRHGELHRQLNMSPKERRRSSAGFEELTIKRQSSKSDRSSSASSSSSPPLERVRGAGGEREEEPNRMVARNESQNDNNNGSPQTQLAATDLQASKTRPELAADNLLG